jgi:hypothetical protein
MAYAHNNQSKVPVSFRAETFQHLRRRLKRGNSIREEPSCFSHRNYDCPDLADVELYCPLEPEEIFVTNRSIKYFTCRP